MARFLMMAFAMCLPGVITVRIVEETASLSMVCRVQEVPHQYQYGISFAFSTPRRCNSVICNHRQFFRNPKPGNGLEDFIVTKRKPDKCECYVNGKYLFGNHRLLISYFEREDSKDDVEEEFQGEGEGVEEEPRCTASTCWDHYLELRYFIFLRTRTEAVAVENPELDNHWESKCMNASLVAPGVKIEYVDDLVRQLKSDGHENVIAEAQHLFAKEDEEVFAGGFKRHDSVWLSAVEITVSNGDVVKYASEGRIVDRGLDEHSVTVQFGNLTTNLVVPVDSLSAIELDKCFGGGFCAGDVAYYKGPDMALSDGSTLVFASEVAVMAPGSAAPEAVAAAVYIQTGENIFALDVRLLSKTKLAFSRGDI